MKKQFPVSEKRTRMMRKICGICHTLGLYSEEERAAPSVKPKLCQKRVQALTARLSPTHEPVLANHTDKELAELVTIFEKYEVASITDKPQKQNDSTENNQEF